VIYSDGAQFDLAALALLMHWLVNAVRDEYPTYEHRVVET
jgi:hypothetical protein